MNNKPIDTARDADLRLTPQALKRAAQRARELAIQTGTAIVICRDGIIEHIYPQRDAAGAQIQEPTALYTDKP